MSRQLNFRLCVVLDGPLEDKSPAETILSLFGYWDQQALRVYGLPREGYAGIQKHRLCPKPLREMVYWAWDAKPMMQVPYKALLLPLRIGFSVGTGVSSKSVRKTWVNLTLNRDDYGNLYTSLDLKWHMSCRSVHEWLTNGFENMIRSVGLPSLPSGPDGFDSVPDLVWANGLVGVGYPRERGVLPRLDALSFVGVPGMGWFHRRNGPVHGFPTFDNMMASVVGRNVAMALEHQNRIHLTEDERSRLAVEMLAGRERER